MLIGMQPENRLDVPGVPYASAADVVEPAIAEMVLVFDGTPSQRVGRMK